MTSSEPLAALSAAGITSERRERVRALIDAERQFYHRILGSFGAGMAPGPDDLADFATELGIELGPSLELLAREDLVHHDSTTGEILVAYPFSGRPTAHRVRINGRDVFAMCAIDALGMAPMLGEPIAIASRDPHTGEEIRIELEPRGGGTWQPEEAVVVSGTTGRGASCVCCCPVLNFFACAENAAAWLVSHPGVEGTVISMQDAIVAGRAVFGDLLKEE